MVWENTQGQNTKIIFKITYGNNEIYTLDVFGYTDSRKYVCLTRYDIEIHV